MLLADGGWGTQLQARGLQSGDCPEEWNVSRPDVIREIAREYFKAGADFCLTNTFGGNRYRLVRHGHAERVREFNVAGMKLCKEVGDEFNRPIIASVGPTGEFIEPEGMLSRREMKAAFVEQMQALKAAGTEMVCIETMYVIGEAITAIEAARELNLRCAASMTYDSTPKGFRTMAGAAVADATRELDSAGAEIVGTNCGNGIADMVSISAEMRKATSKPLLVKSNAGLPATIDGKLVYRETPDQMAAYIKELRAIGVGIVGGCCGTTAAHIAAFRVAIDKKT